MNDTSSAGIVQAPTRNAPWIGIGASGIWTDWRDALSASGLDFTVHSEDSYWDKPDMPLDDAKSSQMFTSQPEKVDMKVNVKGDDNRVLGLVTPRYRIVQNCDAFKMMEPVTQAGGIITNAGMTEQGLCFMVARMQTKNINGDEYALNIMATNSFNGSFPLALIITPVRIICQNMYRQLMGNKDNVVRFRHETNVMDRLNAAIDVGGKLLEYSNEFTAEILNFAMFDLMTKDYNRLVEKLFPYPKPGGARELTSISKVDALRSEFTDRYYKAPDNDRHRGTVFGFVNAYYDYLSHADPTKQMAGSWEDRRLSRLVSGESIKQSVLKEVRRMCK